MVLQEIFGVNPHIRSVADRFAAEGYVALAPALFDRVRNGVELGYDEPGLAEARGLVAQSGRAEAMLDVAAAVDALGSAGRIGVVGFCWGGTLAYAAACDTPGIAAAIGYYGGGIAAMRAESPVVPAMLHFGEQDGHIPLSDVESIRAEHPDLPVFTYPAGHGFNCDARASYHRDSAEQAFARTLDFLRQHLG